MPGTMIQTSDATASGDTTKTLVDTLTVPKRANRIVGISAYCAGGGAITTAEPITGVLELESDDIDLKPMKLPLDVQNALTSGAYAYNPRVWPVNIPVGGYEKISGYVTMDMALTVNSKARFTLIYE